jgi:hypothetical protein
MNADVQKQSSTGSVNGKSRSHLRKSKLIFRWKGNKEHEARVHWDVQGVPTILSLEKVSMHAHMATLME